MLGLVKELTEVGYKVIYFFFKQFHKKFKETEFVSCYEYDFEMKDKDNADRVGKDIAFATELLVKSTLAFRDYP